MRVLQACPYSWHAAGGVQVHVRQLAAQLRAHGHEVLVLAPGERGAAQPWVRIVGQPVALPFNGSTVPLCFGPRAAQAVRDALRDFAPDVVHVHEHLSPSVGMLATMLARVPVVSTFHAWYEPSLSSVIYSAWARLLRGLSRRLTVGIAVSEAAARCIAARAPVPLVLVPNGIDLGRFVVRETQIRRRLLFVNRLDPRKGFHIAVRAFAILARQHSKMELVVVGDGSERSAVEELDPSVRARVTMLGYCRHDDVPASYAAADLFLAPATRCESFGIVLLEAMASGLPVVASDIEGYRDVVRHEVEGLLVPPGDPAALAAGVTRLVADEGLAGRLGQAGRRRARDFSWDAVARRIEAVYEKVVAGDTESLIEARAVSTASSRSLRSRATISSQLNSE